MSRFAGWIQRCDKFSLYPIVNRLLKKHGCGLHVTTAGRTWLEEVIGLAEAGGEGLQLAKAIYAGAYDHFDELTGPCATVIDVNRKRLPNPPEVSAWQADQYVNTLRHDRSNAAYNRDFRQLIHVGFKVAAEMGERYLHGLQANEAIIARNVTNNLFARHIQPILAGEPQRAARELRADHPTRRRRPHRHDSLDHPPRVVRRCCHRVPGLDTAGNRCHQSHVRPVVTAACLLLLPP